MKRLQKLIEYGKNYTEYKPVHDELKKLQNGWTNKRDKYEEAHRAELTYGGTQQAAISMQICRKEQRPAYCGMGTGICRPQNTEGARLCHSRHRQGQSPLSHHTYHAPLDERGAWAGKSPKKEYDLDENGERIRLPSGDTRRTQVDLTGWNDKGQRPLVA